MSFQTDVSLGLRTSAIVFIFYYLYVYLGLTCRHNLVLFKLALITARKNLIKLEDVCVCYYSYYVYKYTCIMWVLGRKSELLFILSLATMTCRSLLLWTRLFWHTSFLWSTLGSRSCCCYATMLGKDDQGSCALLCRVGGLTFWCLVWVSYLFTFSCT